MSSKFKDQVDLLFKNAPDRHYETRENPVTGGRFVPELDPIRPQKLKAHRALEAREWFAAQKPPDAPDLPLNYGDREDVRWQGEGLFYLVGAFARSLHGRDFRIEGHPDFDTFAPASLSASIAECPEPGSGVRPVMTRRTCGRHIRHTRVVGRRHLNPSPCAC